jgi:hypothetical protein
MRHFFFFFSCTVRPLLSPNFHTAIPCSSVSFAAVARCTQQTETHLHCGHRKRLSADDPTMRRRRRRATTSIHFRFFSVKLAALPSVISGTALETSVFRRANRIFTFLLIDPLQLKRRVYKMFKESSRITLRFGKEDVRRNGCVYERCKKKRKKRKKKRVYFWVGASAARIGTIN